MRMFETINNLLEIKLELLNKQLQEFAEKDARKDWDLETGRKFNDLICKYPISEDELLSMGETVCKFVMCTRKTNIDNYLFEDVNLTKPRKL